MIIDFNEVETTELPRFKGGEKEFRVKMFCDGMNKIMNGVLVPGASIGEHVHETDAEILFVVEGEGTLIDDGIVSQIKAGQCAYCPKGHSHSLVNTGDGNLVFHAVVANQ